MYNAELRQYQRECLYVLQVRMPTAEELEAVDIDGIMEELAGNGDMELLTTYIMAASSVTAAVSQEGIPRLSLSFIA